MQLRYYGLLALGLILATVSSATAQQYLEYRSGSSLPCCIWYGKQPVAGVNTNSDSVILPFTAQQGDIDPQHYQLQAGSIVYVKPIVPTYSGANLVGAALAIQTDKNVAPAALLEFMKYKAVFNDYPVNPAGVKKAWAVIKATDPNVDATSASAVEADCAANGMPLTP